MKKLIFTLLFTSLTAISIYGQAGTKLAVGVKAPDWMFLDADSKEFTMKTWAGKVLQVNYVDPDEQDLNEPFNDAVKKALDIDKRISRELFKGICIVDCKSTWKPDFLIRKIAGNKAKKFETTILFDYKATLQNLWGMPEDNYTVVILDKNRVCRIIYKGKIPDSDVEKIIQQIILLTKE
jgi:predicted transcriptional regulator